MSAYKVPERAEMTFAAVRHETGDELEALGEGCRVAVSEELRRRAAEFESTREGWREEDDRTIRSSGLGHAVAVLTARADYLDPEGARSEREIYWYRCADGTVVVQGEDYPTLFHVDGLPALAFTLAFWREHHGPLERVQEASS